MNLTKILTRYNACDTWPSDALPWARKRKNQRALKAAWNECHRGDWLLWIIPRIGVDHKLVVLAACACARLALKYVPLRILDRSRDTTQPLHTIETTEAWCRGEATIEQVREARVAVRAACMLYNHVVEVSWVVAHAAELLQLGYDLGIQRTHGVVLVDDVARIVADAAVFNVGAANRARQISAAS